MNLPTVIDVALGLVVLYLLLSTVCSFGVELLASWLWWRKTLLYQTIARLITSESTYAAPKRWLLPWLSGTHPHPALTAFWNHPLAVGLAPDKKLPSYIEPSTFAAIVIDLAVPGAKTGTLPSTSEGLERLIRQAVDTADGELPKEELSPPTKEKKLPPQQLRALRQSVLTAFRAGGSNPAPVPSLNPVDDLRESIEKWYNEAMARSSGEYKRKAQCGLLALGLIAAAAFNADTIRTAYVLSTNDSLRAATATYAATLVTDTNVAGAANSEALNLAVTNQIAVAELRTNLVAELKELQKLQQLGFPLGWKGDAALDFAPFDGLGWWKKIPIKIAGLLLTVLAVSLGAPFWFDLLNKLVSMRGSGARIPTSEPAKAETKTAEKEKESTAPSAAPPAPGATVPPPSPGDFAADLEKARSGFQARKAYWLAEAALLAYSAKGPVSATVNQWGLKLTEFFEEVEACQAFLAVSQEKKIAVLSFRGTEKKLADWTTDAEFEPVPSPTSAGHTHKGFTEQLDKVYDKITELLRKCFAAEPDTLLYVTGHSLGAALATLMAARLVADKTCGVYCVHTFGSPRVGDPDFARNYELALGHCTYRVVNAEDLVTRVPPWTIPGKDWQYKHVGQVVFLDSDGRMQLGAGFWERFLNTVINAVQDFRNELRSTIKDHSMELYVRRLRAVMPDKS